MTYHIKLPWLALGPLTIGQTSVDNVGICVGSDVKLVDGVCKVKYGVGSPKTTSSTTWHDHMAQKIS